MADHKRTVLVRPVQKTSQLGAANGLYFNKAFQKHMRKALKNAGFDSPTDGKSKFAIASHVKSYSRANGSLTLALWCDAEVNGKLKLQNGGTAKSKNTVPDVKNQKDVEWALDGLAAGWAPNIVRALKVFFK